MAEKYYSILTNRGKELEAASSASGTPVIIKDFVVGDGAGQAVTPDPVRTKLVREVYRGTISSLEVSPDQTNQWVAYLSIPANVGGFTVREAGLISDAGELYAVANSAAIEKPESGISINLQFRLAVSETANIELKVATGDGLFLRQDANLSDVKDKAKSRENLALKGAALLDVGTTAGTVAAGNDLRIVKALQPENVQSSQMDTTPGRLMAVGAFGLGVSNGTVNLLKSVYDIKCSGEYNAMGDGASSPTTGVPAGSGNTKFAVYAGNIYPNQYLVTLTSNFHYYVGVVDTSAKTSSWSKFFNTLNKPSASDVDAVSASQGGAFQKQVQFSQGLRLQNSEYLAGIGYGADSASFDNANLLLKSWYGIGFYSNYPSTGELGVMGYINVRIGRLEMKEQIIPGRYDNFDARYQGKGQAYTKTESDARFQKINTASRAANGWFKDTNTGMIFQWGTAALNANPATVTFPIAFPNACFKVFATDVGDGHYGYGAAPISKSQGRIYTPRTGTTASFFAIGN